MVSIPELTVGLCIVAVVIIIVVFLLLFFIFKFVIAFFPSIVVALIVFLLTGNWIVTAVAFILSALIFAAVGSKRRGRGRY
jgi:hypothetical protein